MTVNGQTETIKSALYTEYAADGTDEAEFDLYLFKDVFSQVPTEEPSFYVNIEVSESLYGKTLDLTKPIEKNSNLQPYLYITAVGNDKDFNIEYYDNTIRVTNDATVTAGTLTATRTGDNFTIKLSVKLSNGNSITADWEGTATKVSFK
ncbi:hypothetical protein [Alistipes sp.]|uniref:hypothetical protein n=1 Tax=Alistipes sp. TaxID=1872444 RepID=UPI003AB7128E